MAHSGNNPIALVCPSFSAPWIIDLGASDHMISLSNLFHAYNPCSGYEKVRIADGSHSPIAGKGMVTLSNTLSP